MGSMGGFFRNPKNWQMKELVGVDSKHHPYFSGQELYRVVIGEGNDYPYGDFDLTTYMTEEVFKRCQKGEYKFDVKTHGIHSNWEILDACGKVVF